MYTKFRFDAVTLIVVSGVYQVVFWRLILRAEGWNESWGERIRFEDKTGSVEEKCLCY